MNYLESSRCPHPFVLSNRRWEPLLGLDDRIKAKLLHDLSSEGDLSQHLAKLDSCEITQIKMINIDDSEVTIEGEAGALRKTIDAYKEHVLKTPPNEIQFSLKRTADKEEKFRIFEEGKLKKNLSKSVHKLGFDPKDPLDKILLFELAKLAAARDDNTSEFIQNYGFDAKDPQDKEMLFEIAKICAVKDDKTSIFIQNYGFDSQDKEKLFEVAKIAVGTKYGSAYIQSYGFDAKDPQDKEKLFEIAKIAAGTKYGSEYIENYGFDTEDSQDKEKLFEIAKIAAAKDYRVSEFIQNYGFDTKDPQDKERLFEIAKIAAENFRSISYYIQNYGFQDKEILFEIAKIAAGHEGEGTSISIKKYGFDAKDKEKLFEIAKIAAASGKGTSEYIKNYGFDAKDPQDKEKLFEIAKIAARNDGEGTSASIKNYGFDAKDKEKLFEIAKIAAAKSGTGISKYIKNYGFDAKDKEKLFAIAKITAETDGQGTSEYIKNYGFQDKELLFEIAKITAGNNGEGTSKYIKNYGFDAKEDKEKLYEIVKIAARNEGGNGISECIKMYGFDAKDPQDKALLFEIAKIAAGNDGGRTSYYIKDYGFDPNDSQDKKLLFEIAKIAAKTNGEGTSALIQNYGFDPKNPEDKEKLFEIARIIVSENNNSDVAQIFIHLINNIFYLKDLESQQQIINAFRGLYPQYPASWGHYLLLNSDIPLVVQLGQILKQMYSKNIGELKKASSCQALIEAFEKVENETNPRLKTAAEHYLGFLLCQSLMAKDQALFVQNIETLKIVPLLGKVYDPALRLNIIGLIGEILGSSKPKKEKEFLQIPLLLYDALFPSEKARAAIIKLDRNLKDGKMQRALMKTLIELHRSVTLSKEETAELIQIALKKPKSFSESLKQLNFLSAILNLDGADLLKDQAATFASQLEKAFIRKVPGIAAEKDFADKFLTTFQQSRAPSAIFQYAASLSKLEGVALKGSQSALATFISSVLNGTFLSERMKLEDNPHLQVLHKQYPEILNKWVQGKSKEIETESKNTRSIPEQLHHFFVTKIITDKHLTEVDLFADYLKEKKNEFLEQLEALPEGSLQKILLQIIDPKFVTFKADRQNKLIEQLKHATPKGSPFLNDLPLLEEIIKGKSIMGKKFIQLTSTDNPYDLLLAGTEVVGSCQNITGSPNLNRGLLGYLLNGHRMITLKEISKNPNQEPIIGRAIFRLLLDSENKPALLLERIYPQTLVDSYKAALKEFAIEYANELGCPVVSSEEGNRAKPFGKDVKSLGGRVDEYVDAAAGIQPSAVYSTRNAYYVTN